MNTNITAMPDARDNLRALLGKAPALPWRVYESALSAAYVGVESLDPQAADECDEQVIGPCGMGRKAADLIVAVCNAIPALLAAMDETLAQLEAERARNAGAKSLPKVVGYLAKTGHGTYFRETITPALAELEFAGTPMWRAVAFLDTAQPLAIIPGAKP